VTRGLLGAARSAVFPAPHSPLNATTGPLRRVAVARAELDDVKAVCKVHVGTVNDVLLTVITGALREWLLSRGEPVVGSTSVRALVPVALQDEEATPGGRVSSFLVDLPVGEPNPGVRLARLGYAMRGVAEQGRSVGADSLIALTGFAPPTMHALSVRAARGLSRRLFNLVVTNVPGPQMSLYAAGSRLLEVFPVVPPARGQGVSIGDHQLRRAGLLRAQCRSGRRRRRRRRRAGRSHRAGGRRTGAHRRLTGAGTPRRHQPCRCVRPAGYGRRSSRGETGCACTCRRRRPCCGRWWTRAA
jgi:hypothetical protein